MFIAYFHVHNMSTFRRVISQSRNNQKWAWPAYLSPRRHCTRVRAPHLSRRLRKVGNCSGRFHHAALVRMPFGATRHAGIHWGPSTPLRMTRVGGAAYMCIADVGRTLLSDKVLSSTNNHGSSLPNFGPARGAALDNSLLLFTHFSSTRRVSNNTGTA
jgi:hypothetical protein